MEPIMAGPADPDKGFILDADLRVDKDADPNDAERTKLFGGRVVDAFGNTLADP